MYSHIRSKNYEQVYGIHLSRFKRKMMLVRIKFCEFWDSHSMVNFM